MFCDLHNENSILLSPLYTSHPNIDDLTWYFAIQFYPLIPDINNFWIYIHQHIDVADLKKFLLGKTCANYLKFSILALLESANVAWFCVGPVLNQLWVLIIELHNFV
jgi:hypothetical protein